MDIETHQAVFQWVLAVLAREEAAGSGTTIGVDATTLEANAALRSIVRRDTGEKYEEFLTRLAKESGIETPTKEQLAKLDRKRPKKGSNDDWTHPHDPDARITKMKDGRTHLAHKAEHAVDMDTGAIVAVTLHGADQGDTKTIQETVAEAGERITSVVADTDNDEVAMQVSAEGPRELVTDKGYHSRAVVTQMAEWGLRTYCSEPDRGRQRWPDLRTEQHAVYANRRRIGGERGRRLLRQRGEKLERWNQHLYDAADAPSTFTRPRKYSQTPDGALSGRGQSGAVDAEAIRKRNAARLARASAHAFFISQRFSTPIFRYRNTGPEPRTLDGLSAVISNDFCRGVKRIL